MKNENNNEEVRSAIDQIELPDDVKRDSRAKINAELESGAAAQSRKGFSLRRMLITAVALALCVAVVLTCISMFGNKAPDPTELGGESSVVGGESSTIGGEESKAVIGGEDNWIDKLFNGETGKNESGEHKDPSAYENDVGKRLDGTAEAPEAYPSASAKDGVVDAVGDIGGVGYAEGEGTFNGGQYSAGLMTAGRLYDNRDYAEFVKLLEKEKSSFMLAGLFPSNRIQVNVPGASGAKVALADASGKVLAAVRTDCNGDAFLYHSSKDLKGAVIGVSTGAGFAEYSLTGEETGTITIECALPEQTEKKLDVLLMLDVTGSMGDELAYLQAEIKDVIYRIRSENPEYAVRLSVNFYKDKGDDFTVRYFPFTEDIDECVKQLMEQYAEGGGDMPEAVDEALANAVDEHAWDDDAVKVMFFVLDAPPHDESERQGTVSSIMSSLNNAREKGIRIVPVTASGANLTTELLCRSAAAMTGGIYTFITDDSGIGGSHKIPENEQYEVEKLNDLMVDVVNSYLKPTK